MASFAGVVFGERGRSAETFPSQSAAQQGVLHRMPGGSRVVLQASRAKESTLTTTAKTDYAGYLALLGKVGTSGALELGAQRGAGTLLSVDRATEVHVSGVFFVDLTFGQVAATLIGTPEDTGGYGWLYGSNMDGM